MFSFYIPILLLIYRLPPLPPSFRTRWLDVSMNRCAWMPGCLVRAAAPLTNLCFQKFASLFPGRASFVVSVSSMSYARVYIYIYIYMYIYIYIYMYPHLHFLAVFVQVIKLQTSRASVGSLLTLSLDLSILLLGRLFADLLRWEGSNPAGLKATQVSLSR